MKTRKLIQRMRQFLSADAQQQRTQIQELQKLLQKLRKRRNHLKKELGQTEDEATRKQLEEDLQVVRMQRRKGQELLTALHSELDKD